jgi:uncharacterized membrane protein
MKKTYLSAVLVSIASLFLFNNCDKKVAKLASSPVLSACDTVSYTKDIKALIDLKCSTTPGCQTASGAQFNGGVTLETYAQVVAKADRIKVRAVEEGTMPPAPETPLTQVQKDLLLCWLTSGKKE